MTAAPASIHDDAAWAAYLADTTAEPTDAERIATLIDLANPYAEARAHSLESFKRCARRMWQIRTAEGPDRIADADWRDTMRLHAHTIRRYDRLARAWAVRQLAEQRDQVEAVAVR